jgi:hypothetical protein
MPLIKYVDRNFTPSSVRVIEQANEIIDEYAAQGFDLTLRQLYYQFVSRDLLRNTLREYKRLGSIVNDARLAGLIDWDRITDRTRNLRSNSHWAEPSSIMEAAAESFRVDKWATQKHRVEVWIEKDALAGVFDVVCTELDVPYFSCRGYTSQSEMWAAAQRLLTYRKQKQTPVILHFGDHDPSGLDMTRDIRDRLTLFMGRGARVDRLALNMDQVEEHGPPPNPAKMTDARAEAYVAEFGDESWELDALDPNTLAILVREAVDALRDDDAWQEETQREDEGRRQLGALADRWDEIAGDL